MKGVKGTRQPKRRNWRISYRLPNGVITATFIRTPKKEEAIEEFYQMQRQARTGYRIIRVDED